MRIEEEIMVFFVGYFNDKKLVPYSEVSKIVIIGKYNQFVGESLLTPIENISETEKHSLADYVRKNSKEPLTKQSLLEQCRILHTINLVNQQ